MSFVSTRGEALVGLTVLAAACVASGSLVLAQKASTAGEWPVYYGDTYGTKYSPLDQINKANVKDLRIAWRAFTVDREVQQSNALWRAARNEETPLMVNGSLYTVSGVGLVAAIDPATGLTRWVYDPQSYKAGLPNNGGFIQRGLAYWTDGVQQRLFIGTADAYLLSIDATTGKPDLAFGAQGKADLTVGVHHAIRATNFTARRPTVGGDVVVVGNSIADYVMNKEQPPGDIEAFDVRTGVRRWTFHPIPKPDEPGYETWLGNSAEFTGSGNMWGSAVYDPELDYFYLPTTTPTNNYYGGHRPGNNLFAESLVCVEAKTGKRIWHFQGIHHGIWDWDFPTHPNLGDITVNGRTRKVVMQVTKQGFTFVFDRRTGEPIWPIEERPVPTSTVPGEWTSPTQPFPTRPPAYELQGATEENLIDFTPELRRRARQELSRFEHGPLFTPPTVKPYIQVPSILGGANWGGAAFDPESGILYVPSRTDHSVFELVKPKDGNMRYVRGPFGSGGLIDGLSIFKPPYSRVTAIDVNRGEHVWMSPLGNGPRNHPLLKELNLPPLGDRMMAGISALVTKTLLVVSAAPIDTPDTVGKPKALLYVFDKHSGDLLRTVEIDSSSAAAPMTYVYRGKQYIVVATGRGPDSELIALALPDKPAN